VGTLSYKLVGLCVLFIQITGCNQTVVPTPASIAPATSSALPALTDTPYIPETPESNPYTDEQAESFLDGLPSVESQIELKDPPIMDNYKRNTLILDALGIDLGRLRKRGLQVGNCIDVYVYELSLSYDLVVDNNACGPGGVSIGKKRQCEDLRRVGIYCLS
jgi:hypothetical protein